MSNLTILVAGAGGYIGQPLCHRLTQLGHRVLAFDRFFFDPSPDMANERTLVIRGDIRDIDKDLLSQVDAVVDLAGLSNDPAAMLSSRLSESVNYEGACYLARNARAVGVRRYVYMSSASVYGRSGDEPLGEHAPCAPQSLYAALKLKVERELLRLSNRDFQPIVLRNATVFGLAPRMRYDLAVNVMTLNAVRHGAIQVDGDGRQRRPFIHVRDVAEGVVKSLELDLERIDQRVFNLGADHLNYTLGDIAKEIVKRVPNTRIALRPDNADRRNYCLDFSLAERLLGFRPQRDIGTGVDEVATHVRRYLDAGESPQETTVQWYKSLIEWDERLTRLRLHGRLL